MSVTHSELEHAMRVLREGKEAHGLYAVEDALEVVKAAARLHWRQTVALSVFAGLSGGIATFFYGNVYWILALAVTLGVILGQLLINAPPLRSLFAPPGLSARDVAEASTQKIQASR